MFFLHTERVKSFPLTVQDISIACTIICANSKSTATIVRCCVWIVQQFHAKSTNYQVVWSHHKHNVVALSRAKAQRFGPEIWTAMELTVLLILNHVLSILLYTTICMKLVYAPPGESFENRLI